MNGKPTQNQYALLDSGDGQKLEQFGPYRLIRPAAQAVWKPQQPSLWRDADARFSRDDGNRWSYRAQPLPARWTIAFHGLSFILEPTDFGHLGLFPEHAALWDTTAPLLQRRPSAQLLNLFAYTGAATLAAARGGAAVCHVDASKTAVAWARDNARLNAMDEVPIRWIVDDVMKYMQREERRARRYDAVILDPPSFGRGPKGELFKVEEEIAPLLDQIARLLTDEPLFVLLSSHTPGFTPTVLHNLLRQRLGAGAIVSDELLLPSAGLPLPAGAYALWQP